MTVYLSLDPLENWAPAVFHAVSQKLIPCRVSIKPDYELNLDLLLLSEAMHHYVLVRNLKSLFHKARKKFHRAKIHLCRNCFHICSSKTKWEKPISCSQQKTNSFCEKGRWKPKMPLPLKQFKLACLHQWLAFSISSH